MAGWQNTTSNSYWTATRGSWNGVSWDEDVGLSEVCLVPTGWETGYAPTKLKITASAAALTVCYKTNLGAQYVFGYTPGDEIVITQAGDIEFVQAVDAGDFQVTKVELYGDAITLGAGTMGVDYLTFEGLYTEVERALKVQGGASIRDLVKMTVNMVYLNEICVCDDVYPLFWLLDPIDDVLSKESAALTAITKASPAAVTSTAHGFVTGDVIQFGTITGMTELSNRLAVVVKTSADAYTLKDLAGNAINSSSFGAVGTAGTAYHRGTTLAKNLMSVTSFAWMGYNGQVNPAGINEVESNTAFMDVGTTSRPTRHTFKTWYDTSGTELPRVLWYPVPDAAYQARIWGPVRPPVLTATTDIPVLPFQFHRSIIAGVITRLAESQVQVENQVVWPGIYKMHLEAIKSFNRKWWIAQDRSDVRRTPYLA